MLETLGLAVSRTLPAEHLLGIATGALSVHGGVIRDVGGRIVAHLATSSATSSLIPLLPGVDVLLRIVEQGQIVGIAQDVRRLHASVAQVLNIAAAGTMVAGLGVVATVAGIAYLGRRLDKVSSRLAVVERDVKDIKAWAETLQRAELRAAIDSLRHAATAGDPATRRELLLSSKRDLGTLSHFYSARWGACRSASEAGAVSELAALAMLAHAAVCSDLGLGAEAATDLEVGAAYWIRIAREQTKTMLFGDDPARLLTRTHVAALPVRTLVGLLDFAHDQEKGIDWIDELRRAPDRRSGLMELLTPAHSALADGTVDLARGLRGQAELLEATVAHYRFLDIHKLAATEFAHALAGALASTGGEAVCVHVA